MDTERTGLLKSLGSKIENFGRWLADETRSDGERSARLAPLEADHFIERTVDQAEDLYQTYLEKDPFPRIPPSLLNSAHMGDYMERVGLVHPYAPSRRKAASYAMSVGSKIAYFDPDASARSGFYHELSDGEIFPLKPNSLVYVTTFEAFQLPHYIAARFNLHIELVHKGLLLGTGPLVDPGFRGHLVVPLHNMTSNEYELRVGDPFIWTEFTKTTLVQAWRDHDLAEERVEPQANFAAFSSDKKDKPMDYYLEKARERFPKGSSRQEPYLFPANAVPDAVAEARRRALNAETSAKKVHRGVRIWQGFGFLAALVAVLTMGALFWMTIQVFGSTQGIVRGVTSDRAAQSPNATVPAAYSYDERFLTAQRLFLDFCTLPASVAKSWPGIGSIVDARRRANQTARNADLKIPFPFPDSIDRTTCPSSAAE